MSAYIVDPRTIDYIVAWTKRHRHNHYSSIRTRYGVWQKMEEVPEDLAHAVVGSEAPAVLAYGYALELLNLSVNEIGTILMRENVRSVRERYPDDSADTLPGPIDQRRVWRYTFKPIPVDLNPAWVVKACDCLRYQSCETDDWSQTVAHAVLEAIRDDAVRALCEDAPWGISEEDLQSVGAR